MPTLFGERKPAKQRRATMARAMEESYIDTTGMDPEMKATLGQEAVRRQAAKLVQPTATNPFSDLIGAIGKLFSGKKKK